MHPTRITRLFSLATCLLAISQVALSQSAPQVGKLQGAVATPSGAPLSAATVYWRRSLTGPTVVQGATDPQGRFGFAIPITGTSGSNTVYLFVKANAYKGQQATAVVRTGGATQHNFTLSPVAASSVATVKGTVKNSRTGKGVPGAQVQILNAGALLTAATGTTGAYSIPGVAFQSGLTIRMHTTTEADTVHPTPCLVPVQRTFSVAQATVVENFSSAPANTYSAQCPLESPPLAALAPKALETNPALTVDNSLQWQQADSASILLDANNNVWNSGHINSILKLTNGTGFVVGSDTGGVWLITNAQQGIAASFNWDSVNVSSLAQGTGGSGDLYAGTYATGKGDHSAAQVGRLWETDTSAVAPLLTWAHVKPQPPCGSINKVLVVSESSRIVVACDSGIYWSPIPPTPSVKGTYTWAKAQLASGAPALLTQNFSGLAEGPSVASTGVASIAASTNGGASSQQLLYHGEWVSGKLVLTPGTIAGTAKVYQRSSIASCPANRNFQYALAADANNDVLGGVWSSGDGGKTWTPHTVFSAGNQGWYNQEIAVSPANCSTVALAFRNAGGFLSFNGGVSFSPPGGSGAGEHSDLHALLFDPKDPNTLYEGSDGGMLAIHGINTFTPTYETDFNRQLLDLQAYHPPASSQFFGLVATSLQDNGTDDAIVPPSGSGTWEQQVDSDGSYSEFVTPVALPAGQDILIRTENCCTGANWSQTLWNGVQFGAGSVIPVQTFSNPRDPNGIPRGPVSRVRSPLYSNGAGQKMYALTGMGNFAFGLFSNDDSTDMHWELIGAVPANENVTALSSFNGNLVYVGTDQAHIFELDQPYNSVALQWQVNNPGSGGRVTSIAEVVSTISFATLDTGYVLGTNGTTWNGKGLGSLPTAQSFQAVLLPDVNDLIAMTPKAMYISHDLGSTWAIASNGLPKIAQGTDLRYVIEPDGTSFIYMSTYGRSLWRSVFRPHGG